MWKKIVLEDLKKYAEIKKLQPILQLQVQNMENKIRRKSKEGSTDSYVLEQLMCLKKMQRTVKANQEFLDEIDRVLEFLPPRERVVLYNFYVDREYDYIENINEELNIERSQIYRVKDKALRHLSLFLYGAQ